MANDLTYFQRRASQEKAAALTATHPRAQEAHLVMAQKYEELIQRLDVASRKLETHFPARTHARAVAVAEN